MNIHLVIQLFLTICSLTLNILLFTSFELYHLGQLTNL